MPFDNFSIIESTLREGEQFSTATFDMEQKLRIAHILDEFGIETPCDPDEPALLGVSFAKFFCDVGLLQTKRLSYLFGVAVYRCFVETIGIEKQ